MTAVCCSFLHQRSKLLCFVTLVISAIVIAVIMFQQLNDFRKINFFSSKPASYLDHYPGPEQHQDDIKDEQDYINASFSHPVKVVCWIKTSPQTMYTRSLAIKRMWGKRCNAAVYVSSVDDPRFPAVGMNTSEGRDHLTEKAMKAFRYVYTHHFHEGNWFLAADDDTYVIMENLRDFLKSYSPDQPIYFGHVFVPFAHQGYTSGGAGYVLSKEALRRLATKGNDSNLCVQGGIDSVDDVRIGQCLETLGVKLLDSRDSLGRSRFNCFNPQYHIMGMYPDWYYKYDAHGAKKNFLSDSAISFHYVNPELMYTLNYLLYHLRPIMPSPATAKIL